MAFLLKNKKGATLTELVVGLAVLSIIITASAAVLVPVLQVNSRANELAERNLLLDNIANLVIGDLASSTENPRIETIGVDNELFITISAKDDVWYSVSDEGALLRNGDEVLPRYFYANNHVSFDLAETTTPGGYTLTVTLINNNGSELSRGYAVNPLVLNQY